VTGEERIYNITVVFASRVGVADQQANGRAGGQALIHTRQDFYLVGFLSLRNMARRTGTASIKLQLNVVSGQGQSRRTTVYYRADCRPVRFAKISDAKKFT
jgi:hypothetical protein